MISFTLLAIIAAIFLVTLAITVIVGGASAILIYGDVILCVVLIVLIVKALFNRKRK